MNPNALKNCELIKQYPFVSDILSARMEPYDGQGGTSVNDLTICVEKADGDLMYRRGDNVGLGGSLSCIFQFKCNNRKDQVMRCGEYAFAVNKDGRIINRLNFPRNKEERRQSLGEVYGWHILWSEKSLNATGTGYLLSGCLWQETKYIVWATVEVWHAYTKNDTAYEPGDPFGEFKDRLIHITIYGAPDQGFEKLHEESSKYSNLLLDNRVISNGVFDNDFDTVKIVGILYEL